MSMYGVNASVPKTLVRHLVHYYADTCEDQELKEVLYDVLDTPVSPELLPPKDGEIAQKTEDLVGPYELHDFFLYYLLRFSYEPSKIYVMHLRVNMMMQPSTNGYTHSAEDSLSSSSNAPVCRMARRLEPWHYLLEETGECRVMLARKCGCGIWRR